MRLRFLVAKVAWLLAVFCISAIHIQDVFAVLDGDVNGKWHDANLVNEGKAPYASFWPESYLTSGQFATDLQTDSTQWLDLDRPIVRFQDEGGTVDPSDPTQISPHLVTEFEWTKLADGDGDTVLAKWSPWIPLTKSSLFTMDIPLPTYSGTEVLGDHTGIGDIRMRYFYLFKTQNELVTAIAPSLDVIAPTGDVDKGLGGGTWLIMPNIVTVISPAKNWSNYVFLRYVHSIEAVQGRTSTGDFGIPSDGLLDAELLRGLSLECSSVFQLQEACFDYAMFTPDYFQNFTGSRSSTLQFKYEIGKAISEKLWIMFEAWHPVGGEVSNDFTLKIKTDIYF